MAPRKSQSANLTSSSSTLDLSSTPSKVPLRTSTLTVTPTPNVSESLPLPAESFSSTLTTFEEDIGELPSNSTEISDEPVVSEDGSDSRLTPIATEDPGSDIPTTFSYNDQSAAPVNGTVIGDPSGDASAADPSIGEDPKAASTSFDLGISIQTSTSPTESSSPNRAVGGNSGLSALAVPTESTNSTPSLLFTPFTSEGTVYVVSTFASTFETTLPNGSVMTTAKAFTTHVPVPTAQANAEGDSERPRQELPGPFTAVTPSSETFFQRPAAAAGVFVVIGLISGSLIWMFIIIRRHRRQVAAASKEPKRQSYMYGSTGISPRDRRSYMSYESHNWPQRFDQNEVDNDASTPHATPAANPAVILQGRPSYVPTVTDYETPQIGLVFASSGSALPAQHPILRSHSFKGNPVLCATSPPIPARSPLRLWSPPTRASTFPAPEDGYYRDEYTNAVASGSNQHSPTSSSGLLVPSVLVPISRTVSSQPSRRRTTSSVSFDPHSVASTSPPVIPRSPVNVGFGRNSLDRQRSTLSSYAGAENPFRSSAYIVPSPTPSGEMRVTNERLSNPFEDAESPPHSPVAFTFVRDGGATQNVVLERGVSIRRNDSLRNRPEQTQSSYTRGPSMAEWGSSGSEAASSSTHLNASAFSRAPSGYQVMERRARKSESMSTAETSAANSVHRICSLDEGELFYNPAFAVASPVRGDNPQFPDVRW